MGGFLVIGLLSGLGLPAKRFVHVREGVLLSKGLAMLRHEGLSLAGSQGVLNESLNEVSLLEI